MLFSIKIYKNMNFINPLTLLIVPLIGSLIILAFPILNTERPVPYTKTYKNYNNNNFIPYPIPSGKGAGPALGNLKGGSGTDQEVRTLKNKGEALKEVLDLPTIEKNYSNLKKIAILTSLINFIFSIILWIQFDSNYIGYQFVTSISGLEFIQLNLGIDGISLFFVILTTFITPIALLSSHNEIEKNLKFYLVSILLLETLQIAVFVVLDLLLFYIFFESVLIPLFFIVGVWGASSAKVRAAFLLFLYTLKNQCKRAKLRGTPKALITKLTKETY
jgi:hypothetical protein